MEAINLRPRSIGVTVSLVCAVGLAAWLVSRGAGSGAAQPAAATPPTIPITAGVANRQDVPNEVEALGTVQSIDSVSVDDFSGGASAAQYLKTLHPQARRISILAGPVGDSRSAARVEGFRSVAGGTVFASPTWYYEGALTVADRVIAAGTDGIFCCADRLAEGVVRRCIARGIKRPLLISFDDAPIAQWLNLTTMAISWNEMVGAAIRVIKQRQVDQTSSAIAQLVSTKLIVRS